MTIMRKSHLVQFAIALAIVFGAVTVIGQDHRGTASVAPTSREGAAPQPTPAEEHDRAASGGQYTDPGQINIGY
jgi:hypothetical protein